MAGTSVRWIVPFETALLDMIDGAPAGDAFSRVFETAVGHGQDVSGVQLFRIDPTSKTMVYHRLSVGVDPDLIDHLERDLMRPEVNPVISCISLAGTDRLRHVGEFVDWNDYVISPVHQEFAAPAGTESPGVMLHACQTGIYMAALGLATRGSWLDARQARQIEHRLKAFLAALDVTLPENARGMGGLGVVIDRDGFVLRAPNPVAFEGLPVRLCRGRLVTSDDRAAALLDAILRDVWSGGFGRIVLSDEDGQAYEVKAQPGPAFLGATTAIVDCFAVRPPAWNVDTLALVHGLTRREAAVTLELLCGHSVPEIGERLEVKADTVRIYLRHVFAKTGARNQPQLLSILTGGTATRSM